MLKAPSKYMSSTSAAAAAAAAPPIPKAALNKLNFETCTWPIAFRCSELGNKILSVDVSIAETIKQLKERVCKAWGCPIDDALFT